jgi:cytohesin
MSDIHDAIENRDRDEVKDNLLADPSVVHAEDGVGNRPLHIAAYTGQPELVELLLDSGAEINALGDMKRTPLHCAAMEAEPAVAEILLKRGADAALVGFHGNTPLFYAVQGQLIPTEVAKILLKYRVSVDLNSAVWLLSAEDLRQRLESDRGALRKMAQPERLLAEAIIKGDLNSVTVLIQHGVPVNGTEAARPLILALSRLDILKELLQHGADTALTDSFGENVLEKASASGASDDILKLLQAHNSKH